MSTVMARALARTRRIGGSIVVTIPKEATEQEGIRGGELVEIEIKKARKDWFGALEGIGRFSKDDELDTHG